MPDSLPYAPTPPRDRVEVLWQGSDFDLTIPPAITWRGIAFLCFMTAFAVGCLYSALGSNRSTTLGESIAFYAGKAMIAAMGFVLIACALVVLRRFRTWARIRARGDFLSIASPGLLREEERRFRLDSLADANVEPWKAKQHGWRYLALHRHDRKVELTLDDATYRDADLELAAQAINRAISLRSYA